MSTFHGQFVWCELMTTNPAAAADFYAKVIGWSARDAGAANMNYTILSAGDVPIGGMLELPEPVRAAGGRPGWIGYIGVDDVDAMAARVTEAGGTLHRGPGDIPDVGRFAVVADPQGAPFTLFKPLPGEPPPPPAGATPGRVGWHELHAGDWETAFGFYSGLFGWTRTQAIDMGPMGTYQTFASAGAAAGQMTGGMMTKMDATPRPHWLFYFTVDRIEPAMARAQEGGGQVLRGPQQVPGGSWIAQCLDPQGAMFAMVGPER